MEDRNNMKKKVNRMVKKEETVVCCDKCGKIIEPYTVGRVLGQLYNVRTITKIIHEEEHIKQSRFPYCHEDVGGHRLIEYDLCDKCYNEFCRWLEK